jgi:hypothetical protein
VAPTQRACQRAERSGRQRHRHGTFWSNATRWCGGLPACAQPLTRWMPSSSMGLYDASFLNAHTADVVALTNVRNATAIRWKQRGMGWEDKLFKVCDAMGRSDGSDPTVPEHHAAPADVHLLPCPARRDPGARVRCGQHAAAGATLPVRGRCRPMVCKRHQHVFVVRIEDKRCSYRTTYRIRFRQGLKIPPTPPAPCCQQTRASSPCVHAAPMADGGLTQIVPKMMLSFCPRCRSFRAQFRAA